MCEHLLGAAFGEARCFLYRGRTVDQQFSLVPPRNGTSEGVDWYQVPPQGPRSWTNGEPDEKSRLPKDK